uniref:Uncharacterized protein n=1 Tax=Kalanchoe fedtschenkoi TaxID=63787 RepID=A0A7N0UH87_KALFE
MGLLDKLWDDTVAGPRPESGLGKLRKNSTFSPRLSSSKEMDVTSDSGEEGTITPRVTRSIMIVRPPGVQIGGSAPSSPAGSTPPVSPFSGGRETFRFRRMSTSDACEKASGIGARGPTSPYDV